MTTFATTTDMSDRLADMHCDQREISCFEDFARDLAEYATQWIPRCQNKIIKHAREMFADATMRDLITKYAGLKRDAEKSARHEFVMACLGEDTHEVDSDDTYERRKFKSYAEVLDDRRSNICKR